LAHDLDGDTSVGGPTLAAAALRAGVVDDVHVFAFLVLVGGGTSCGPPGLRLDLRLAAEHRFADGTVHLHYTAGR
jgi:riboflavin biosynthesis pyrimidine reductase